MTALLAAAVTTTLMEIMAQMFALGGQAMTFLAINVKRKFNKKNSEADASEFFLFTSELIHIHEPEHAPHTAHHLVGEVGVQELIWARPRYDCDAVGIAHLHRFL